jgi:hypothetical protein
MLQRIKGMVAVDASGPETLAAVVAAHQVLDQRVVAFLSKSANDWMNFV